MEIKIDAYPKCKKCDCDLVPIYKREKSRSKEDKPNYKNEEGESESEQLSWKCPECNKCIT